VLVSHNLIHGCGSRHHHGDDWDGINVKDGITDAIVTGNVVYHANRGIQLDSPAVVTGNVLVDLASDGVTLGDGWTSAATGSVIEDDVVVRASGAGVYVGADELPATGLALAHVTVVDPGQAGIVFAANAGLDATVDGLVVEGGLGLDGWGAPNVELGACAVDAAPAGARAMSSSECLEPAPTLGALGEPEDPLVLAGPDAWWGTADDGWVTADGGATVGARVIGP
jgi:hypothetical protein